MMTEKRHCLKLALLFLVLPLIGMNLMWMKKMWMSEYHVKNKGYCMHGNRMGHCPECNKMKTDKGSLI
ncbi:MAG: hypothetical protein WBI17_02985 [Clostridiaceae bacterium]